MSLFIVDEVYGESVSCNNINIKNASSSVIPVIVFIKYSFSDSLFWTISRRSSMIVLPLQGNQSKFSVEDLRVLNVSPHPMIVYQRMPLGMYIEPPSGRKVINITPRLYVGVSLMSLWVTVLTAHAPPLLSIKVSAHGCCVSQALILVFLWRIRPYNRNQLLTNQNSASFFKILLLLLCHSFV